MRNFILGFLFAVIAVTSLAIVGSPRVASAYTALQADITENGLNQGDLVKYLGNVRDAVNEMITDHATNRTTLLELKTLVDELHDDAATLKTSHDAMEVLIEELHDDAATNKTAMDNHTTSLANFKTIYDAHTHTADGNAARTSLPDTGSPVGSPSAASAFTNTVGTAAATLTAPKPASGPATLTAGKPTAPAAALTNSTALKLTP